MGKFEIKKSARGYKFNLKAGNGEIIASSEPYASQEVCRLLIEEMKAMSVPALVEDQTHAGFAPVPCPKFEIYLDRAGEFRFRLRGQSGNILAVSEGYRQKASCQNGIQSVKRNAPVSDILLETK